uniref:Alpha/beta hydrolase fold-3 domain-containing protein n=1 Tax=Kalanchoe fedtschenkoi TaxID=63787 RepID=A0A7N0T4W4_KALFE
MASSHSAEDADVTYHCKFFQIHRNGVVRVHRPMRDRPDPPPSDPRYRIRFRDVVISQPDSVTARIFLPEPEPGSDSKLPVILYIHGGGFCMLSPYAAQYHRYCTQLAAEAGALVVSVDYGLFPDRPIPACYDDSWAALKWVAAHSSGSGPDPWLTRYADFNNVFIAGDSAGGNITHTLALRVGLTGLHGAKVVGAVLVHPFFGGTEDDAIWLKMCPTNEGVDDPRMNPSEEDLAALGCEKVLIFVAEKDHLCEPGKRYYEKLMRSGWRGKVEMVENLGMQHCFHIVQEVEDEHAAEMLRKVAAFVRGE